ncbi:hypothetical protein OH77DRAFT_1410313, partial [Trametes cingulata]
MRTAKRTTHSGRLIRWDEYIARFDATIEHVPGKDNKVADCLSRYFESEPPDVLHRPQDYVNADVRLDKDLEFLTDVRREEVLKEVEGLAIRAIRELVEDREKEAEALARPSVPRQPTAEESGITVRD